MADLAAPGELEAVWRPLDDGELRAAETWLRWASAHVRAEFPTIDARIAAGTLDPDLVSSVVVQMVKRVLGNPDGAKSMSETIEEYSRSITLAGDGSGGLELTDRERALLTPNRRRAFSIVPG